MPFKSCDFFALVMSESIYLFSHGFYLILFSKRCGFYSRVDSIQSWLLFTFSETMVFWSLCIALSNACWTNWMIRYFKFTPQFFGVFEYLSTQMLSKQLFFTFYTDQHKEIEKQKVSRRVLYLFIIFYLFSLYFLLTTFS